MTFRLTVDDKQLEQTLKQLPVKYKKEGEKDGKAYSKGLTSGLKGVKGAFSSVTSVIKAFSTSFVGLAVAAGLGLGLRSAVNEASALESALVGLRSVAKSTGADMGGVEAAARQFSQDGVIPLRESTAALKILLLNFNGDLDRSVKTFKAFRDAAAFGRQGTLSLGEAIVGASEGLKNDLSIKVDNVGITRNLSQMQKEYAASIGTTIGKLTEAQKTTAEYLGVQKDALVFQGDYNKSLGTFNGVMSKLSGSWKFLLADIGAFVTESPAVLSVIDSIAGGIKSISTAIQDFRRKGANAIPLLEKDLEGYRQKLLVLEKLEERRSRTSIYRSVKSTKGEQKELITAIDVVKKKLFELRLAALPQEGGEGFVGPIIPKNLIEETKVDLAELNRLIAGVGFTDTELLEQKYIEQSMALLTAKENELVTQENFEQRSLTLAEQFATKRAALRKKETTDYQKTLASINTTIRNTLVSGTAGAMQLLANNLVAGKNAFQDFGNFVIGLMGDLAISIGKTLLLSGKGIAALKSFGASGAIAAGLGLIAVGSVLKAFAGKGGGVSGGSTGGDSGDGGGVTSTASTITEPTDEVAEPSTTIQVTIQGDVLDSQESGTRIVGIINDAYDKQGVTIQRGAVAA